ncbi:hypothetical protein [Streptomyces sp. CNQ085]|uniref:hypothetical protein n=1 Tax=Streptomyces sp. CNQ085 TaxID=2886944 RepID=UPI001F5152FB|nr:hypothetical protein [Streptomyces sp. CNQ085]MCI0385647.1 hypothetical protein [Streptomyces sp. CNQ085]
MASRRAKQVLVRGWAALAVAGAGATLALDDSTDGAPGRYGWYETTPGDDPVGGTEPLPYGDYLRDTGSHR